MQKINKLGDFSGLAKNYSKYRVGYSETVLNILVNSLSKPITEIDFLDVGAGTGIWTRMVNQKSTKSSIAIEPNLDMFSEGSNISSDNKDGILWINASAEDTQRPSESADWLTMASSFHWTNFEKATEEFHRVLKKDGLFTALWNPRFINSNPILINIENFLKELKPDMQRVSSGSSGMTATLMEKLNESKFFDNVFYLESIHIERITPERYLGLWKSVNDIQVQLGEYKFNEFLNFIIKSTKNLEYLDAEYKTRSWSCKKI